MILICPFIVNFNQEDEIMLCSETNVFIHASTSSDLEEDLSVAIDNDVNLSQRLLDLAKKIKSLELFVFISTAFVNSWIRRHIQTNEGSIQIEEEHYRLPFNPHDVDHYLQTGASKETITRLLTRYSNNCSTLAKALAEHRLIASCEVQN
jgi:nucleoside-diphosphate-sugar epimerase